MCSLSVRVNGRTSNTMTFSVEVFTVTGTYEGPGVITSATCNDPDFETELRMIFPPGATGTGTLIVIDERPQITFRGPSFADPNVTLTLQGTLNADGSYLATTTEDFDDGVRITTQFRGTFLFTGGQVTARSTHTLTLTVMGSPLRCEVVFDFEERRISTGTGSLDPAALRGADGFGRPDGWRRFSESIAKLCPES